MEKKDVNDLLKPRIKVTQDWPFNDRFEVGSILTFFKAVDDKGAVFFYHHDKTHHNHEYGFFKRYPKNFKEMDWWEDITIMDLPDYIKWTSPGQNSNSFFKVNNWYSSPNSFDIAGCDVDGARLFIKDCLPATEQDYIQSKTKA